MPTTYKECEPEMYAMLDSLISEYRDDLREDPPVTIRLQWAFDGLKHHGWPALGVCKINSYKDRVERKTDVTITLDGDRWPKLPARRRLALLHHELHHVERLPGYDLAGRPKLRCRPHDHEMGMFFEMIQLYGRDSVEQAHLDFAAEAARQKLLPLDGKEAPEPADFGFLGGDATLSINSKEVPRGREAEAVGDLIAGARQPASTIGHGAGSTAIADEPIGVDPDLWRAVPLEEALGTGAADRLWESGEMATVGDLADFLSDGNALEELPAFDEADCRLVREAVEARRLKQGWADDQGIPRAWIEARPEEEAEKPKRGRKAKRPA